MLPWGKIKRLANTDPWLNHWLAKSQPTTVSLTEDRKLGVPQAPAHRAHWLGKSHFARLMHMHFFNSSFNHFNNLMRKHGNIKYLSVSIVVQWQRWDWNIDNLMREYIPHTFSPLTHSLPHPEPVSEPVKWAYFVPFPLALVHCVSPASTEGDPNTPHLYYLQTTKMIFQKYKSNPLSFLKPSMIVINRQESPCNSRKILLDQPAWRIPGHNSDLFSN